MSTVGKLVLDPKMIRDIRPQVLDDKGDLKILPGAWWSMTTVLERALLCHNTGLYGIPTTELVLYIKDLIGDRKAIEIGAGRGDLARALGIPATDSRQQDNPRYRAYYERLNVPTIPYGPHVAMMDAKEAVAFYKPSVVVASWVTHRYDHRRHWAGGNEVGVNESDLLNRVETYILVGNEQVHRNKQIWDLPHEKFYLPFLYSRAHNGSKDFLAVWEGRKRNA